MFCAVCCAVPPVMAVCWASRRPFLYQVAETVIQENQPAYPELLENEDYVIRIIKAEGRAPCQDHRPGHEHAQRADRPDRQP